MLEQYPHLSLNESSRTTRHILPREVKCGTWKDNMTTLQKYAEYLSSDEIPNTLVKKMDNSLNQKFPEPL